MNAAEFNRAFEAVRRWADRRREVVALGLAGSWARGQAGADSDIDFVILTGHPSLFRNSADWLFEIASQESDLIPSHWNDEDWGDIWCRRVRFSPSTEVEFNFATPGWASTNPIAEGSRRVVSGGFLIVVDKQGILSAFVDTLSRSR